MPIDALLFDKDGTLFDFGATWNAWAGRVLLELSGGEEARAREMAETLRYDWAAQAFHPDSFVIAETNGEVANALVPHVPGKTAAELERFLSERAGEADLTPAVPLAGFLDGLNADGKTLGVMTNDSELSARSQLTRAGCWTALPLSRDLTAAMARSRTRTRCWPSAQRWVLRRRAPPWSATVPMT